MTKLFPCYQAVTALMEGFCQNAFAVPRGDGRAARMNCSGHARSLSDNPFEDRDVHRLEAGGQVEATRSICRPHGNPGDQSLRALDGSYDGGKIGTC